MNSDAGPNGIASEPEARVFTAAEVAYKNILEECLTNNGSSLTASSISFLNARSKKQACMLGIDEAGRGPVLGPMLYACAIAPINMNDALRRMGLADSKQLTKEKREELLGEMLRNSDWVAYNIHSISPMEITEKMLSSNKVSLNAISQNCAIGLIRSALAQHVNLTEVYVDTVGKAETYQAFLMSLFPSLKITVESKADATYPIVSAASIFAKVTRDRLLARWPKEACGENVPTGTPLGSGYPGDPLTKQYLCICLDPIFGFPPVVRQSWSTAQNILDERAVRVLWEDDLEAEETKKRAKKRHDEHPSERFAKISGFFKPSGQKPNFSKRQPLFTKAGLVHVEQL